MTHTINTSALVYERHPTNSNLSVRCGTATLTGDGHSHLFKIYADNQETIHNYHGRVYSRYYWTYDIQKMCTHANNHHLEQCCEIASSELKAELKDQHEEMGSQINYITLS